MDNETKALTNWDEELAKAAEQSIEMEKSTKVGTFISLQGGVMTYLDQPLTNNSFNGVVLAAALEQVYYENGWNPDAPTGPSCFAFGIDSNNMVPDASIPEPMNHDCKSCPKNAWGTAVNAAGKPAKGKACKTKRRLIVIPFNQEMTSEDIMNAEVAYISIPTMSIKNWANYIRKVTLTHRRPFWAMATKVFLTPDKKTQFQVHFDPIAIINVDLLGSLKSKVEEASKLIMIPYTVGEEAVEEAKPKERAF